MDDEILSEAVLKFDGNEIRVRAYKSGAMTFSSDAAENFIYFYPHQAKLLKAILADLEAA